LQPSKKDFLTSVDVVDGYFKEFLGLLDVVDAIQKSF